MAASKKHKTGTNRQVDNKQRKIGSVMRNLTIFDLHRNHKRKHKQATMKGASSPMNMVDLGEDDSMRLEAAACSPMPPALVRSSTLDIDGRPLPNAFYCPITHSVMRDPVMAPDGNSYERAAIESWLEIHKSSPKTRRKMHKSGLIPNRALREAIADRMGASYVIEQDSVPGNELSYRGKVSQFLSSIGESVGKKLHLNSSGVCAFSYENLTIIIECPRLNGSVFIYASLMALNSAEDQNALMKKLLSLNYLQQEVRGGCIGIDPANTHIMYSFTDRIDEIQVHDFRNILENFIDTSLKICRAIRAL